MPHSYKIMTRSFDRNPSLQKNRVMSIIQLERKAMPVVLKRKTMFRTSTCYAILAVIVQFAITGAQIQLTSLFPQRCIDECEKQGFCCGNRLNGEAPHTSAERLSCSNGCEIAYYSADVFECKDYCEEGNQEGCSYKHPLIATKFSKYKSCQEGCNGSPSLQNIGCEEATKLNFYNQLETSWLLGAEEVEESQFDGGVIISESDDKRGSGCFNFTESVGYIQFNLDVDWDSDGYYLFKVRYSYSGFMLGWSDLIFDDNYVDGFYIEGYYNYYENTTWAYTTHQWLP